MRLPGIRSRLGLLVFSLFAFILVACEPTGGTGGQPQATSITVSPAYLSFDGTSSASISVTANGRWTLASDSDWLKTSRATGSTGTTTVNVTIDRGGLAPRQYAGELTLSGVSELATITVSMRFPTVSGQVSDAEGRVTAGSRAPDAELAAAAREASDEVVPGEYLVLLNDGMARVLESRASGASLQAAEPSLAAFQAMASMLAGDHGLSVSSPVRTRALPLLTVRGDAEAAARLAEDGRVRFVEPRTRIVLPPLETAAIEITYDFDPQWHYEDINLSGAWNITQGDPGVVVAVIDGGFATWDYMLAPNLLPGYDFAFDDADPSAYSACTEHGTHVAGTVASTWHETDNVGGVAPNVRMRLFRVGYEDAGACALDGTAILYAILHAAGLEVEGVPQIAPVDVINLSLGGYVYSDIFKSVIDTALDAGVSVVAAAGNDGHDDLVMYPAAYDGVIGVSATDINEQRAYYSNAGQEIDVTAPGGDTRYDLDGDGWADGVISLGWDLVGDRGIYKASQGTSMASPHVAAVVALMKSVNPDLDPASVMLLLRSSARDLGIGGPDTYYGWGMVDAGAAVGMARDAAGARFSDVTVRLRSGASVVASATASASGAFDLGQVASGSYTLEAGTDRDGDGSIDDAGEYYASTPVTVTYAGDVVRDLDVDPR